MSAKNCPHCENNQGWWVRQNEYTGELERVRCEYCHTEPDSVFNTKNVLKSKNSKPKKALKESESK